MTTTFFVLGLAAFAVAVGLRDIHQSSRSARIGFGLLVVGALFVCLAGVFKEFILHAAAGRSHSQRRHGGIASVMELSAGFGLAVDLLGHALDCPWNACCVPVVSRADRMPGLQQRAFLCLFLLWLSIVVHRLVQITRGMPSEFEPTANAPLA